MWASAPKERAKQGLAWAGTRTFPLNSLTRLSLFPRGWGSGRGGSEGSLENYFPNTSKKAKVPVLWMEAITWGGGRIFPLLLG